tara:strand:+ start:53284 stop:56427 length:3144 start_codon:yes stop_codon:yes gene_type:complete
MFKIAHLGDTHIRNLKYHQEYRIVFKELYKELKKKNPDYIVHCGDIAHTKTQLSPEYFQLASEFLSELSAIAPLIVILGNHDGNLKNENREDAISPIVKALDDPRITLLKNSGEYSPESGLTFNVLSVFDRENWIKPSNPSSINIALYHGSISGCMTDSGWAMEHGEDEATIFNDHDYALLGDIHKPQFLDGDRKVGYCGSTIQQNFGEDQKKGYMFWLIKDKNNHVVSHYSLYHPKPFVTVILNDDGTLPEADVPKYCRLRLVTPRNLPISQLRKASDMARIKWRPYSVAFLNRGNTTSSGQKSTSSGITENLRDLKVQEKHIREYLKDYKLDESIVQEVLEHNIKYNRTVTESEEVSRNVVWRVKEIEWDNLFNYGGDNKINFESLRGLVGIFGKNYSGKSSIIDSILFSMFNSTSKGERKNVHIINQNKQKANAKILVEAGSETFKIVRNLTKYEKKLKGKVTTEAKTDLDFHNQTADESLNGTTRNETDANIRKKLGTLDDFFLTSMASQLDSLAFVKEGSTKRKEILAKFLDLELFDKKFKLAKKDASDMRGVLKRLQGRQWAEEIEKNKEELAEIATEVDNMNSQCESISKVLDRRRGELVELKEQINSVPVESIDIDSVRESIKLYENQVKNNIKDKVTSLAKKKEKEELATELEIELSNIPVDKLNKLRSRIVEIQTQKSKVSSKHRLIFSQIANQEKKLEILENHKYDPNCKYCINNKFVKDAKEAMEGLPQLREKAQELIETVQGLDEKLTIMDLSEIEEQLEKYDKIQDRIDKSRTEAEQLEHKIEKFDLTNERIKSDLQDLHRKEALYEENKETIENLGTLLKERISLRTMVMKKEDDLENCKERLQHLYIEQGSLQTTMKTLKEGQDELEALEKQWTAYDLFMQCMHPNGIPYNVIKQSLPLINEEIAKVLANIVEFEVFFDNTDGKLDIYIKHPNYDPRPLSMGSGAEKTIAAMAIRLALISITNLPKSELFILDEPATALDQEHMEGFIRLLDMIKNQFKTVILISHLDSLKDVVDMTIDIQRDGSYAKVRI